MTAIDSILIRTLARLGQTRAFFSVAMPEIFENNKNTLIVTADLAYAFGMDKIAAKYPDRFVNVGIAEQNMVTISSGLAAEGFNVFSVGYASFIASRAIEQVKLNVLALNSNVKIVGAWAGVSLSLGVSHYALEDVAFMRSLPGMAILSPADSLEAYKMAFAAAETEGPVYVRLSGGMESQIIYKADYDLMIGKAVKLSEGGHIAILATGLMVREAMKASEILEKSGIGAAVYNFHTIKPLDETALDEIFCKYKLIATAEEHSARGGLGGAVAEYKTGLNNTPRQLMFGMPDSYLKAGQQNYMWGLAGITAEKIATKIEKELL